MEIEEGKLKKCGIIEGCQEIEHYKKLNRIHEGVYGTVYRALQIPTGEIRAIKRLKMEEGQDFPITSLREISILKGLTHPNITRITRVATSFCQTKIYLVMQYVEHELKDLLSQVEFTENQAKKLMKDLLEGINFLHSRKIIHRDLKTSNLLYSNEGKLKICDFGLARKIASSEADLTQEVVTMWYRPPELLIGAQKYGLQVDIWSVGCIMAEIVIRTQLFKGTSEIQQIQLIFKLLGSPNEESWPEFKTFKKSCYMVGKKFVGNKLRQKIPKENGLSDQGINLLTQLLIPNPARRITAQKALKHPWFNEAPIMCSEEEMPKFPASNQIERYKKKDN